MAEPLSRANEDADAEPVAGGGPPLHGYQGDRLPPSAPPVIPAALTIAISREAGSRGSNIAQRVAARLGWQVYQQETLEYIAQEGNFRQEVVGHLDADARAWVEENLDRLLREQNLSRHPAVLDMARIVLSLGAGGEVIMVGRGAGYILPAASTLHVRIIAPLDDRIAYMAQWLRLTTEEAGEQVRLRDSRRVQFIETHFHRRPGDAYLYDVILNSSLLGEELCADLIVQAARGKQEGREKQGER